VKTTELNAELTPRLVCSDLQIGRAGQPLLPPVNLAVRPGEVWVLVGRNGSGKSTLLHTLLGSLKPVGGAYTLQRGCRLGHVPQRESHDLCVPARGVDMVESGADRAWGFWRWGGRADKVDAALTAVGAHDVAREPFGHLSEGQKQRILMARALVSDPDVLVLDEPTSAMDPLAEQTIYELISQLQTERSLAVIIASHSLAVLPAIATHVVYLDRDDQVVLSGAREDVLSSAPFRARYGQILTHSADA